MKWAKFDVICQQNAHNLSHWWGGASINLFNNSSSSIYAIKHLILHRFKQYLRINVYFIIATKMNVFSFSHSLSFSDYMQRFLICLILLLNTVLEFVYWYQLQTQMPHSILSTHSTAAQYGKRDTLTERKRKRQRKIDSNFWRFNFTRL